MMKRQAFLLSQERQQLLSAGPLPRVECCYDNQASDLGVGRPSHCDHTTGTLPCVPLLTIGRHKSVDTSDQLPGSISSQRRDTG
jgi:hypothetical protein